MLTSPASVGPGDHSSRGAEALLWGGLAVGLAAVLVATWSLPEALPAIALAPVLVMGWWQLTRRPLAYLGSVMVLFILVSRTEAGIQPEEVVFGVYYVTYLVHWYVTRFFVYRERVLLTPLDKAVFVFLAWVLVSPVLTVLFGGDLKLAFSEWIAVSMWAFFFPLKEACTRYRYGPQFVLCVILATGLFAGVRNLFLLQSAFTDATQAWQIARGRVPMNELLLMIASVAALVMALFANRLRYLVGSLVLLCFLVLALVLSQSRAYWGDFFVGAAVLFFLVRRPQRIRLVVGGLLSAVAGGVLLWLLFGDVFELLVSGLVVRLFSVTEATSHDISLFSRYAEWSAVWELIKQNPVLGYGPGYEFGYFDLITSSTWVKSYVHNGFLMVWFRYGLIGLTTSLFAWAAAIWVAFKTTRRACAPAWRISALIATGCLIALLPSHGLAVLFNTPDTSMGFTLVMALAAGTAARVEMERRAAPLTPPGVAQ